jgi:hypothetical protein
VGEDCGPRAYSVAFSSRIKLTPDDIAMPEWLPNLKNPDGKADVGENEYGDKYILPDESIAIFLTKK